MRSFDTILHRETKSELEYTLIACILQLSITKEFSDKTPHQIYDIMVNKGQAYAEK